MPTHRFFPPPVQLNQAQDSEGAGGGEVNRRSFIKRTGGATAAAFVAWTLAAGDARADGESGDGSSCSKKVAANPNAAVTYSGGVFWDGHGAQASVLCNPPGGPTTSKTLTMKGEGWKDGGSAVYTSTVTVVGEITSACEFAGSVTPDAVTTYKKVITPTTDWVTYIPKAAWPEEWETESNIWTHMKKTYFMSVYLEITERDHNDHESYAKGKIYLCRVTKLAYSDTGGPGGIESVFQATQTDYSPSHQLQNAWTWQV